MSSRRPTVPIMVLIATKDRAATLRATLESFSAQTVAVQGIIVIDASSDARTREVCDALRHEFSELRHVRASAAGAAMQRNHGVAVARHSAPALLFADDDIRLAPDCTEKLWAALDDDAALGGVSAMISNQRYVTPGLVSRGLFRLLHGRHETSYAGMCIGPALNLLPEDRDDLPAVVPVQWLNTTCTLYRSAALPQPPFSDQFTGYSLLEDVALSLTVGTTWRLANARTARVFHDSQPGTHKSNGAVLAHMELVNRHYVMTSVLGRRGRSDYARLALLEVFGLANHLRSAEGLTRLPPAVRGKLRGIVEILRAEHDRPGGAP